MLRLTGISLSRAGRPILNGVELEVARAQLRFLVGASGSGKTTILRLAAGLERPDQGRVLIDRNPATESRRIVMPPHARNIGMVFQDGALWDHMTVEEHLRFGLDRHVPDRRGREQRIHETLAMVDMSARRTERPGHLSGGERQRVGLARALVRRPSILLLDEPLAHVDLPSQRHLAQQLAAITANNGITTLWVTHRPGEVAFVGGAVSVLQEGRIAEQIDQQDVGDWLRVVGG